MASEVTWTVRFNPCNDLIRLLSRENHRGVVLSEPAAAAEVRASKLEQTELIRRVVACFRSNS